MDINVIRWKDEYSVGDATIDAEHKKLISLIGEIDEHCSDPAHELLKQVLDYAEYHFRSEEDYMKKIGYPDLDTHIRLHKKLIHTLTSYQQHYEAHKISLSAFKSFLFVWVRDHILDEDIKISKYLIKTRKRA